LHMAQLMPLPLTVSCFSKIQIGFTFLVPAHLGSPRKGPLNGCVCVCVSMTLAADDFDAHAGMPMPRDRVKLDVTQHDDVIQVSVLHAVRVRVAFEHLYTDSSHR